jgi:hypothetical protein
VRYYTWEMDKPWSGNHTLRLYVALYSDEVAILVQAQTKHCGLNACLFKKKLADSAACECARGNDATSTQVVIFRSSDAFPYMQQRFDLVICRNVPQYKISYGSR